MIGNVYYYKKIYLIGGVETFFYELARKYQNIDLVIYYDEIDAEQLKRLSRYVHCIKRKPGEKVYCKKAFFNYDFDMIDDIIADEYIFVIHNNYKDLPVKPPYHEKITRTIAVSEDSAKAYTELTGIPCECFYNPISFGKTERLFVTASRLKDRSKGRDLMIKLIRALDKISRETGIRYVFMVFSDSDNFISESPNVMFIQPNVYIRPYLKEADYVVQLSSYEGYCYTVNEALSFGTGTVVTDLNVYRELGIDDTMSLFISSDGSNVEEIARKMLVENPKVATYLPPEDKWGELFSNYREVTKEDGIKVRGIIYPYYTDIQMNKKIYYNDVYYVSRERADLLIKTNVAEYVDDSKNVDVVYDNIVV